MEMRDGFIIGIFNYCDSWCTRCTLSSRCRLFADLAEADARADRNMASVCGAPPLIAQERPASPLWIDEIVGEPDAAADDRLPSGDAPLSDQHEAVCERARAYCRFVYEWLALDEAAESRDDSIAVIGWYAALLTAKIQRALVGLAEFDGHREFPPDHEGCAKVALIGIERSQTAWHHLAARSQVPRDIARAFIDELEELRQQLEMAIPLARAFVRPGFDEPEAIARLRSA